MKYLYRNSIPHIVPIAASLFSLSISTYIMQEILHCGIISNIISNVRTALILHIPTDTIDK